MTPGNRREWGVAPRESATACKVGNRPAKNAGTAPPVSASHMEIGRPAAASALDSALPARTLSRYNEQSLSLR